MFTKMSKRLLRMHGLLVCFIVGFVLPIFMIQTVFYDVAPSNHYIASKITNQNKTVLLEKFPEGEILSIYKQKHSAWNHNHKSSYGSHDDKPKTTIRVKDLYESGFSYPNAQLCPNHGLSTKLMISVISAPDHFSARDAIRLTWGHYLQRRDVSMAFILGHTKNGTVLDEIEKEKRVYDDLVVANFEDSYYNLTLKSMAILEWTNTYCNQSKFVLKTDDDMFINVPNLLKYIDKIEPEDKKHSKIYGRLASKRKPFRDKSNKYYVSFKEYEKSMYPDFIFGTAYLYSTGIVHRLFKKSMEKPFMKLEDVFITGFVAEELAIERINNWDFRNTVDGRLGKDQLDVCSPSKFISMHVTGNEEQFVFWKQLLDGITICKT